MKSPLHQRLIISVRGAFTLGGCNLVQSYIALILALIAISSCQQTGNAPKLQSHLQGATTSSQKTAGHIQNTKNSIERIDYKASRAQKILDEGFSK